MTTLSDMNVEIAPVDEHTGPARHFRIRLSSTARGARLARHLAAEQLTSWGWPYDCEGNRTASLLVAELAANAVRHGQVRGRDFALRLTLYAEDATLRIEVTDARPDRSPPAPRHAHSGRPRHGVGPGPAPGRVPVHPLGRDGGGPVHEDGVVRSPAGVTAVEERRRGSGA
ncbi:hypothetical protein STREPTOSP366_54500 [Streptomyces variabilis]